MKKSPKFFWKYHKWNVHNPQEYQPNQQFQHQFKRQFSQH